MAGGKSSELRTLFRTAPHRFVPGSRPAVFHASAGIAGNRPGTTDAPRCTEVGDNPANRDRSGPPGPTREADAVEFLVDTCSVPPEHRFAYWRSTLGDLLRVRVRDAPSAAPDFRARLAIHRIDRVSVVEIAGPSMTLDCGPDAAAPEIVALAMLEGAALLGQGGRSHPVAPGELCLYPAGQPLELALRGPAHVVLLAMPEREFVELFPQAHRALGAAIPATDGAPALFLDHVAALARRHATLDATSAKSIADSIVHMAGAVACRAVEDAPHCEHRTRAKIRRILKVAQARLRDPDLDVGRVAAAVHLSTRQIHRLFANEPMSLMQWVLVQRLEHCHRELARVRAVQRPIGAIAFDWGFSDAAHFSRAFRKHFGESPSEVRRRGSDASSPPDDTPFDAPRCQVCRFRSSKRSR